MASDPIVDEVHKIREKLFQESGGDLAAYMARLKEREREHRERLVSTVEKAEMAAPAFASGSAR